MEFVSETLLICEIILVGLVSDDVKAPGKVRRLELVQERFRSKVIFQRGSLLLLLFTVIILVGRGKGHFICFAAEDGQVSFRSMDLLQHLSLRVPNSVPEMRGLEKCSRKRLFII